VRARCGFALAGFAISGAISCVDALKDAILVVRLKAPADPIELTIGATQTVYVQALGADRQGVTGAQIIFVQQDDERIAFGGASDGTDAITANTADSDISGLSTKGLQMHPLEMQIVGRGGSTQGSCRSLPGLQSGASG
jgi:hypothetical protein